MNFPLYIAKRYLISASKNNAINIINGIASLGIIVGVAALFVVLSVFSGLVDFSLSFSNSVDPDLRAVANIGKSFTVSPQQLEKIQKINGVASYSKVIEERVLYVFNNKEQVAFLKGVDQNFGKVSTIEKKLFNGQWFKPNTIQAVVGYGIAQKLSLGLYDFNNVLEVYVPKPGLMIDNPNEAFNKMALVPMGIYAISEELDSKYVYADFNVAQEFLGYRPDQFTAIEFKLKPNANESQVVADLKTILGNKIGVKNRAQMNDSLYKMLNTENIVVYLIFTLVITIALFNLIGALIMMILDKKTNLKTLFNLGSEIKDLRKIFLLQGTLLSVFGGIIGLVLGIAIVFLQQQYQLLMITQTLAYPVKFTVENIFIVLTTIVLLGFIASLIASSRVSKRLLE